MKFTTLIPNTLNDGTPVPVETINRIAQEWAVIFGGCSIEGTTRGLWIDPADQQQYQDESTRITVVCPNEMYEAARLAVIAVGHELEQKAMYFEVRDFDGVRFLTID